MAATWIDLLDPTADELRARAPRELEEPALERLLAPPEHEDEPRPTLVGHGDYVFGVFLVAVAVPEEDSVYYQEIDLVLTHDTLLTVRKTPPEGRPACDVAVVQKAVKPDDSAGLLAYRLVDEIAERYLDLVDTLDDEIDLLAGVRDYSQAKIANDQNEVMKVLTVIASIVLLPTFIVGVYGQNFDHMPELNWRFGYAYSWGLIVVLTLVQLWFFRRKRWF